MMHSAAGVALLASNRRSTRLATQETACKQSRDPISADPTPLLQEGRARSGSPSVRHTRNGKPLGRPKKQSVYSEVDRKRRCNRESARRSRSRRADREEATARKITELGAELQLLSQQNSQFQHENHRLRNQLEAIRRQWSEGAERGAALRAASTYGLEDPQLQAFCTALPISSGAFSCSVLAGLESPGTLRSEGQADWSPGSSASGLWATHVAKPLGAAPPLQLSSQLQPASPPLASQMGTRSCGFGGLVAMSSSRTGWVHSDFVEPPGEVPLLDIDCSDWLSGENAPSASWTHVIHSADTFPRPSNCIAGYNQQSLHAGSGGGGAGNIMRDSDFLSAAAIFDTAGELSDIGGYASAAAFNSPDGSCGPLPGPGPHPLPGSGPAIADNGVVGISWPI